MPLTVTLYVLPAFINTGGVISQSLKSLLLFSVITAFPPVNVNDFFVDVLLLSSTVQRDDSLAKSETNGTVSGTPTKPDSTVSGSAEVAPLPFLMTM